jgi:type VI secretion system protein ImpK
MANTPQAAVASAPPEATKRSDNLSLVYQEIFTVIARLRANRQRVADAESFRSQIINALKLAEQDGLRRGYPQEYVRVATFAVAALLDESILNSQNPVFSDWPRKPLNNELFGNNIAGEVFFQNVDRFLGKPDSEALADLLELHELCLLLGFRGRYGASTAGEIRAIVARIEEKIRRIRAVPQPKWQIGSETVVPPGDRWIPVLRWVAVGCIVLALILFGIFKLSLSSSAGDLRSAALGTSF